MLRFSNPFNLNLLGKLFRRQCMTPSFPHTNYYYDECHMFITVFDCFLSVLRNFSKTVTRVSLIYNILHLEKQNLNL